MVEEKEGRGIRERDLEGWNWNLDRFFDLVFVILMMVIIKVV